MQKNTEISLKSVERVANALEEINDEVMYVGGAIVSLYATDMGAELPRPTTDIDISVKVSTYSQMNQLAEKLAEKGIRQDLESDVLYRYKLDDISIDFIPFEDTPLGPTNSWLKPAFQNLQSVEVGSVRINISPVSLFLANKWEAFQSRGEDPRTSPDFEDIIYVIDNNLGLLEAVEKMDKTVKQYLAAMARYILEHPSVDEIIECHINPYTAGERKELIIEKLEAVLKLDDS